MRLRRCLCLLLLCVVICCVLFSVSAYAAVVEQYSYNGVTLPQIPEEFEGYINPTLYKTADNVYIVEYHAEAQTDLAVGDNGKHWCTGSGYLTLVDGSWIHFVGGVYGYPIWTSIPVKCNGSVYLSPSEPVVSFIDIPEPFSISDFMSSVGQILTSAVSWVGDVGSTILQQPLLLAFTALPLCGLGIAVFRRLKETV